MKFGGKKSWWNSGDRLHVELAMWLLECIICQCNKSDAQEGTQAEDS